MTLSALLIAESEERKRKGIVQELTEYHSIRAIAADIPQDVSWVANGVGVVGDIKTPADFIASYQDGRLHKQVIDNEAGFRFVLIEGAWSQDGGWTVGAAPHGWTWTAFDNARARLHTEGVFTALSYDSNHTALRLAELYRWTGDNVGTDRRSSMQEIEVYMPTKVRDVQKALRLGMLMHLPGCGQKTAELLYKELGVAGTIDCIRHSPGELLRLRGIGQKTIDKWRSFLG